VLIVFVRLHFLGGSRKLFFDRNLEPKHTFKEFEMIRNKHQEDSTDDKEGNNGLEAMISSFEFMTRRSESKNKTALQNTADKFKMDFHVYGMKISLFQPNISLIKLTFSARGIVLMLQTSAFSTDGQQHAFG
jgi:hypothetical protein